MTEMMIALLLFLVMYVCLLTMKNEWSHYIVLLFALLFVRFGLVSINAAYLCVPWAYLGILLGAYGLEAMVFDSKMLECLVSTCLKRVSEQRVMVLLCLLAGCCSALFDTVLVVMLALPIVVEVCKRSDTDPMAYTVLLVVVCNLFGACTMLGDPTSLLLASNLGMQFRHFFYMQGRIGIGVIVVLSVLSLLYGYSVIHKEKMEVDVQRVTYTSVVPSVLFVCLLAMLCVCSNVVGAYVSISLYVISLLFEAFQKKNVNCVFERLKHLQVDVLLFVVGITIVMQGLVETGVVQAMANACMEVAGVNVILMYGLIVCVSFVISGFVDTIPFVATFVPVVMQIANSMEVSPYLFVFGCMFASTLGGNLTPVGARSNMVAITTLQKEGYTVKTKEFVKLAIPFTMVAFVVGTVLIYWIWN